MEQATTTKDALFHCKFGVIQRAAGRNAVKAAAYHMCTRLSDGRKRYNFLRKSNEHAGHALLLPEGAPEWARDPAELWRRAERAERRGDAQTARWIVLSIPRSVPSIHYLDFARSIFGPLVNDGMAVQLDIHHPPHGASDGGEQPHVNVLMTMRKFDGDQFAKTKTRTWNDQFTEDDGKKMRSIIAQRMNDWMAAHGLSDRVDHRSNVERGLPPPREPDVPRWQFEKRRQTGQAPDALADLLVQRRARKAGYNRWQAHLAEITGRGHARANAFRPADPAERRARKERFVAMMLARHYDVKWLPQGVAERIESVQLDAARHLAFIRLRDGSQIIDAGDAIALRGRWSQDAIKELVEAVSRNGWEAAEVAGTQDFKDRITTALALRNPPVRVTNHTLSPDAQAKLDAELARRESAAARRAEEARQLEAARQAMQQARRPPAAATAAPEANLPGHAPAFVPAWQRAVQRPPDSKKRKDDHGR
jgi:hypothetical protein